MAGKFCDVCGKDDIGVIGVFSSSLGPMSLAYCLICTSMYAEPKFMIDATIYGCGGDLENINKGLPLIYYDSKTDSYIDMREGNIPIKLNDGREFKTRSEVINCKDLYKKEEE